MLLRLERSLLKAQSLAVSGLVPMMSRPLAPVQATTAGGLQSPTRLMLPAASSLDIGTQVLQLLLPAPPMATLQLQLLLDRQLLPRLPVGSRITGSSVKLNWSSLKLVIRPSTVIGIT